MVLFYSIENLILIQIVKLWLTNLSNNGNILSKGLVLFLIVEGEN